MLQATASDWHRGFLAGHRQRSCRVHSAFDRGMGPRPRCARSPSLREPQQPWSRACRSRKTHRAVAPRSRTLPGPFCSSEAWCTLTTMRELDTQPLGAPTGTTSRWEVPKQKMPRQSAVHPAAGLLGAFNRALFGRSLRKRQQRAQSAKNAKRCPTKRWASPQGLSANCYRRRTSARPFAGWRKVLTRRRS